MPILSKITRRQSWIVLSASIVILMAGLLALRFYKQIRDFRLEQLAREALEQNRLAAAHHLADRLLKTDPGNPTATRILFRLSRMLPLSEERLHWTGRLFDLEPSPALAVRFLSEAISLQRFDQAAGFIREQESSFQHSPAFQALAGLVFLVQDDLETAKVFFERARNLEPENREHELNLLKLGLAAGEGGHASDSIGKLLNWSQGHPLRGDALFAVYRFHQSRGQISEASRGARLVIEEPSGSFSAKLDCFDFLEADLDPETRQTLSRRLQELAADNVSSALLYLRRAGQLNTVPDLWDWIEALPTEFWESPAWVLAVTTHALTLGQRERAEKNADRLPGHSPPVVRKVLELKVSHRTSAGYSRFLKSALSEITGDATEIAELLKLFSMPGWELEQEALLWELHRRFPENSAALRLLNSAALKRQDTLALLEVARAAHRENPNDLVAANNFSLLRLLLGLEMSQASTLAEKNYSRFPDHPAVAATYALSLVLNEDASEALPLLDCLAETTSGRAFASIQLYRAMALQKVGEKKAATQIAAAIDPEHLLPEERQFLWNLLEGNGFSH